MAYGAAPLGIGHGRNHMRRFVQQIVFNLGGLLRHAPSRFNAVVFRIGLRAKFGHHNSVDAHLSAEDQFLRVTP